MQLSAPHYYYRIFDDALAIELKSSIPNDPFTGRVLASPIRAPRTIDLFRRAIAVLESISLSRLGCIFDYEESELTDGLAGETPLPILSLNLPGTTKEQPFFIVLSRIINGVAEPYLSSTDKNQLLYLEKPLGWVERNYVPESTWVGEREVKLKHLDSSNQLNSIRHEGELIYVDPRSLRAYYVSIYGTQERKLHYRVIVARTGVIGYLAKECITSNDEVHHVAEK